MTKVGYPYYTSTMEIMIQNRLPRAQEHVEDKGGTVGEA